MRNEQAAATFVGFGFGAIQAGLFLYEAHVSCNFRRLVVAEVMPDVVNAVRAGGQYTINVAHTGSVEQATVGPLDIYDPAEPADRAQLIVAIASASEMATAVPSVRHYVSSSPGSIHRLLAEGLLRKVQIGGPCAVIYAAENHNHAAEILEQHVRSLIPIESQPVVFDRVRFLNTVIGKMSGVTTAGDRLAPITPGSTRAFLVEDFNRILISRIDFAQAAEATPFVRSIQVLQEKENLLPFEEAKLYGHNALHAMSAYLAGLAGLRYMSELSTAGGILEFVRSAVIHEPGAALVRKYAGADAIFTPAGFADYADDLLVRMINPHLRDAIERVVRDPERKLGWEDRLVGAMRIALQGGVEPKRFALGAAAALAHLRPQERTVDVDLLHSIWRKQQADEHEMHVIAELIGAGWDVIQRWRAAGFPDLETFYQAD